jgi:hypothetical protein
MIAASVFGLALSIASLSAAQPCRVEDATYTLTADPAFTAGFRSRPPIAGWLTDVFFYVRSARSRRTYWFMFDKGSARHVTLISTTDVTRPDWRPPGADGGIRPLGDMTYIAADRQLRFQQNDIPKGRDMAPYYVLLPDLAEKLWYSMPADWGRESAPLGFFKQSGCAVSGIGVPQ